MEKSVNNLKGDNTMKKLRLVIVFLILTACAVAGATEAEVIEVSWCEFTDIESEIAGIGPPCWGEPDCCATYAETVQQNCYASYSYDVIQGVCLSESWEYCSLFVHMAIPPECFGWSGCQAYINQLINECMAPQITNCIWDYMNRVVPIICFNSGVEALRVCMGN